jgi:two-component system response regulator LytT
LTRFTICDDEPEHGRLIGKYIKTEYAKHVPETDTAEVVVYQSPQEMLDEAKTQIYSYLILSVESRVD